MTEREGEEATLPLGWRLKYSSEEVSTSSTLEAVSANISLTLLATSKKNIFYLEVKIHLGKRQN